MRKLPVRGSSSCWGVVQQAEVIAPGIVSVSTAGHGGIVLDEVRAARVKALFPDFTPFAGNDYSFEEDCDWALVVLAFQQHFRIVDKAAALQTVRMSERYFGKCLEQYYATCPHLQGDLIASRTA